MSQGHDRLGRMVQCQKTRYRDRIAALLALAKIKNVDVRSRKHAPTSAPTVARGT
jgi:hypothetical protein